jgi:NUMOD4 motif/HNH endonuclease
VHPQDTIPEEWRPVVGYEGIYSVSSLGHVRRDAPGKSTQPGRILQPVVTRKGYHRVTLTADKRVRKWSVHVLVALAFLGPRPPGWMINHLDGIKTHNVPSNLEYCTALHNSQHAMRLGLHQPWENRNEPYRVERLARGERHYRTTLTDADVREIRTLYAAGWLQRDIAARFHCAQTNISAIIKRHTWCHVV